ncbi:MAG: hypothetical protein H0W89_07675 [Candidatus Levybacteria bacterium]|nr:hypothetical protein [Candidatus Levybacteria bacterium]
MRTKYSKNEREYWANVCIACSQVTFGVFWGSIIVLQLDLNKVILVVLNLTASSIFWWAGRTLIKK